MKKFSVQILSILALIFFINCQKEGKALYPATSNPAIVNDPGETVGTYNWIYVDSINTGVILKNSKEYFKVNVKKDTMYTVSLIQYNDMNTRIKASFNQNLSNSVYDGYSPDSISPVGFVTKASQNIMYIKVDGSFLNANQSNCKIMIHEFYSTSNIVSTGTWQSPTQWNGIGVHKGTVSTRGSSYFEVSGLNPNTLYWITCYSMTGDTDLDVCVDNTFSLPYMPSMIYSNISASPEQYKYNANAFGKLFLKINSGPLNRDGASFKVLISPVY